MKNMINWFEIPAKDISRAISFYKKVLDIDIQETDMMGTKMGFLPSDGKNVSGAIVQGDDYKPGSEGTLLYLNGGDDLQNTLSKVEPEGVRLSYLKPKSALKSGTLQCSSTPKATVLLYIQ